MCQYLKKEWKEFRENILELDNYTCTSCGRTRKEGATLQVHHLIYNKGKLPWEYATRECTTLCKGCHAEKHGLILPRHGWDFVEMHDLEDLIGECEYCNNPLRYSFLICHENWGYLNVGTNCCDNLTNNKLASNNKESYIKYINRKKNFVRSQRWLSLENYHSITHSLFKIKIIKTNENRFNLTIHNLKGEDYNTLEEAKEKAFDVIENGSFRSYLDKYNL